MHDPLLSGMSFVHSLRILWSLDTCKVFGRYCLPWALLLLLLGLMDLSAESLEIPWDVVLWMVFLPFMTLLGKLLFDGLGRRNETILYVYVIAKE